MYYVYVIQSMKDNTFYIGYSSNLKRRIFQHNNGESSFTSNHMPWKLVYYEAFLTEDLALEREGKLKQRGRGWQELRKRIGVKFRSKKSKNSNITWKD